MIIVATKSKTRDKFAAMDLSIEVLKCWKIAQVNVSYRISETAPKSLNV